MTLLRLGLPLVLVLGTAACAAGGTDRASDIQNLNGISDDIAAVTMTQSETTRARDPNIHSTIPRTYEVTDSP
ncbi:MAG TPA: hypothetical protein VHW90_02275 [Stellaceae bacterium]|jgi:hypothetical protein|nr:hypothetical protein [Stellaceae bacterium]